MALDRTDAIRTLLTQTSDAHGRYEETELQGVYDQDWARWYAAYAIEHGIGDLIGHAVTTDQLAAFLTSSNVKFERVEPKPDESWAAYTARLITVEL